MKYYLYTEVEMKPVGFDTETGETKYEEEEIIYGIYDNIMYAEEHGFYNNNNCYIYVTKDIDDDPNEIDTDEDWWAIVDKLVETF